MKCHRHPEHDATAICKHCTKGLCPDCTVDGPGGTACGDECAKAITLAHSVLLRSGRNLYLQREGPRFAAVLLVVVGLFFIAWSLLRDETTELFTLGTGIVFTICGVGAYAIWRRFSDLTE